jgi:hypothetical protein
VVVPKIGTGPVKSDEEKLLGMIVVFLGLGCSIFTAYKIKKKVEEINRAAELSESQKKN